MNKNLIKILMITAVVILINDKCIHVVYGNSVDENNTDTPISDIEKYFDFTDINDFLEENTTFHFKDIVNDFAKGDMESGTDKFFDMVKKNIFSELSVHRSSIKKILALAFVTALFSNFAGVFKNSQVSDMGFLICYIAIMTYLIGSFTAMSYIAYEVIGTITDFMKALIPVYAVSIGISDGQGNAAAFYEMALVIIGVVDFIAIKLLLPAIDIFVGLGMINNLGNEDYLSKSCELIKSVVGFLVKSMVTLVMGLNIIQKMFSPLSGGIGGNAARNMVNTISGISITGNGIAELLYGTGKIIKNSIGGAGVVIMCVILAVPLIKMIIFILTYQLTNAIIQPVSDSRITKCISCISEAAIMMLRTVFAVVLMFVITITIICIS